LFYQIVIYPTERGCRNAVVIQAAIDFDFGGLE